jgi:hypothetical protein
MTKTYTEDDLNHMVAREVAKQRMDDMQRLLKEQEHATKNGFHDLKLQIQALSTQLGKASADMRIELRAEMERDFATKLVVADLKASIASMWTKISYAFVGVTAAGAVVQYFLFIANQANNLLK